MREDIRQNRNNLKQLFDAIETTDRSRKALISDEALETAIHVITEQAALGGKLIFIGNGGSAAIASHMATDFWKNAGIKAIAFNDSSLLTCISNDHGYEYVFEKSIEMFGEPSDVLIAISSSGKSENILRGVTAAQRKGLRVLTLSGFKSDNPLRGQGDINFYVPASHYGHVEVIHHAICHCLIDVIIKNKSKKTERAISHE